MISELLNFIFPKKCIICGEILNLKKEIAICESCDKEKLVEKIDNVNRCKICSRMISFNSKICKDCLSNDFSFDKNFSLFKYNETMKNIISRFKFEDNSFIGILLSELMCKEINLNKIFKNRIFDFIIPVPIHWNRERKRGFNQSKILAKKISQKNKIFLETKNFLRVKNTKAQFNLNKIEREENLRGAFCVKKNIFKNKNIILIDDIFTTGSTINNCAKTLKKIGSNYVASITLSITIIDNL
ncbi:MAG: ComF family protein [Clostridiales bacterium]|jgi:ComF family protein|nr:ComF family protein [Clostridiales bacterium]